MGTSLELTNGLLSGKKVHLFPQKQTHVCYTISMFMHATETADVSFKITPATHGERNRKSVLYEGLLGFYTRSRSHLFNLSTLQTSSELFLTSLKMATFHIIIQCLEAWLFPWKKFYTCILRFPSIVIKVLWFDAHTCSLFRLPHKNVKQVSAHKCLRYKLHHAYIFHHNSFQ